MCVQGALSTQEVAQKTLVWSSRPLGVTGGCRQHPAPHTGRPGPGELRAAPHPRPVGSKTDLSVHSELLGPMAVTGCPMEGAGASQRSSPRGPHRLCDQSVSPTGLFRCSCSRGTALQRPVSLGDDLQRSKCSVPRRAAVTAGEGPWQIPGLSPRLPAWLRLRRG